MEETINEQGVTTSERTVTFRTECEKCIFAKVDTTPNGIEQNGCEFDRLYKFEDRNLVTKNETNGFYTINTVCNTFRKPSFLSSGSSLEEIKQKVEKQIEIQIDFLIIDSKPNTSFQHIIDTIHQCNLQVIQPRNIKIVTKNDISLSEFYREIKKITSIPFKLIKVFDQDKNTRELVDEAVLKLDSTYYTIIIPGNEIDKYFISGLNRIINYDLRPFSMVKTPTLHLLTIQTQLHKLLGGNKDLAIEEKIEQLAQDQLKDKMIINHEAS